MRLFAIALGILLASSTVCPVFAQNDTRWEAPNGLFSLDFQAWGWTELPPDPGTVSDPPTLLGIEHRQFQQNGLMRTCYVTERRIQAPLNTSQETLNAIARANARLASAGTPRSSANANVDGVTVNEAIYDQPVYHHARWFFISHQAAALQIIISCGATGPVSSEVEANIANIANMLQSLRIESRS
jgi:hypothetical protein